jgi:ArsR family transcriptional regulator
MSKSRGLATDQSFCPPGALLREPLSAAAAADMAVKLKALADPVRLQLFSAIASHAGGEACVCDISRGLEGFPADRVTSPQGAARRRTIDPRTPGVVVYYAVVPDALASQSVLLGAATDTAGVPA